ncbi:FkbM family methyltransferase [Candidatus Peribacteria bacterium]|nr:FkbM family methyltransferase [Candidatus Peribacteria bacterium]
MASITYRIVSRWRKSLDWFRGLVHVHITLRWYVLLHRPIPDIALFQRRVPFIERREYSQNGEDGIIHAIFAKIGTTKRYFVEFGAEDGLQCNTRYLSKHFGWKGLLMDGGYQNASLNLYQEFITAENIEELFQKHEVPERFDLLSIDIDGNDYWVWKAITRWHPRVVIVEYNACIPALPPVTIPYKADFAWDKTDYYGASLGALHKLGVAKGYTLIGTDKNGVNAFFVLDELVDGNFVRQPLEQLYHSAAFKGKPGLQHPRDPQNRPWVEV